MTLFVTFLKDAARLSSVLTILGVFGIGILLLFGRRTAAWGRRWLVVALAGYWFASTPLGARLLAEPFLRIAHRVESPADAEGARTIVIIGGGIVSRSADGLTLDDLGGSALRVIEGARLYRMLGGEPLVIVSGGNTNRHEPPRPEADAMRDGLTRLGVPAARIVSDTVSMTTREQATVVGRMLAERGIDRFVLVTNAAHMPRSLAVFRVEGLHPVPSTSRLGADEDRWRWSLLPAREPLLTSDAIVYDCAAWFYYAARGWFKPLK